MTLDLRSLAAFRMAIGAIVCADALLRTRDFGLMFGANGMFPIAVLRQHFGDRWAWSLAFLIDAAFVAIFEIEGHAPRPTKLSMIPSAIRAHLDAFVVTLVGGLLVSIALLCRAGAPMLASMVRVAPDEIVWLGVAATEVGQLAIGFGALFVAVAIGYARLPPADLVFLQRKFVGTFMLCTRLRARVDLAALFEPHL
jgi:hypothetical protein